LVQFAHVKRAAIFADSSKAAIHRISTDQMSRDVARERVAKRRIAGEVSSLLVAKGIAMMATPFGRGGDRECVEIERASVMLGPRRIDRHIVAV
jgi:hypothetical protein